MHGGWEGNRRSGVTLAIHHRLHWFIHLQAQCLEREMGTPTTLLMGYGTLYFTFYPLRVGGWASLISWLLVHTRTAYLQMVLHLSINWAQQRVALFVWQVLFLLNQATSNKNLLQKIYSMLIPTWWNFWEKCYQKGLLGSWETKTKSNLE